MSMNPYSDLTQPIYSAPDDQGVQTKYTQLDSATDAFQGGMYTAAEGVANSLGADGVRDWAGQNALANYQEAGQFVPTGPQRVEQIDSIGGAYDFAKNKFVENVPQMATTIGGTLLGAVTGGVPGAVIGGALTSAPSHLGEAYGRQKEEGIDNPMAMYGSAAINTGLDLIPSSAFVGAARRAAVKEMGKGSLARAVMTNVVAEAIPEAAQGIVVEGSVGNMPPPNVSTPEGEAYWMDRLNEAAAGGVVGGTMGGIGHAASYPTQILQQAKELPGSMYDQVSNRVTNTVNNFRSSPEEQAANKLAAQKKHEQYGFIGQSTDPAYIEKRANMTSYLQNKREQGLPLEPWEEQALMSLPQDDRRSLMANANNTRDVYSQYDEQNNEQTNTTGLNELGPQQLDQLAYAAMDGTLTPEDVSLIDNDLPDTQYAYIESKIAELSRRADSAPSLATDMNNGDNSRDTLAVDNSAPYSSQLDGLEEIAIDIVQGDITQGNSLKLDMLSDKEYAHVSDLVTAMEDNTGITAATPFSFDQDRLAKQAQLVDNSAGDTFEGPELQFTQGESLEGEGDFQDRPEATLQSRYEQMAGEKFLGTGKINESSKKDKLTGLKKRYDEVNYIMDPEKLQAALPNYTAKYTRDTIDKNNKTLDAYNTSGKNAYSYIPLSEALEKEVIRDMGSNAGAIDSNENSFASLLAARKETAAKDIMARATQKTGKLADYRQSLMDKGDYDTLIDLHQAIQSSPKDIIDNPTAFDYADRQKLEVGRTASNDASKDTTDMSLGYVPLANGKALNLPKALTKRMVQIQKAGDTTLTINEIYAQAKQGADATPEMQNLRRDALSSIMAEYSDELGSRLMNENDVIDLSPLSNMTKPERVKFTEDLRKLNINWVTDKKGKKHAGPYSLPNKVKKIVEVAATDKRIAESGFIPLQAKPNQNENTQTVLDLNKAIRLAQDHLKSKSLPSTEKDALQMVIANYRERLGNIPGEQSKVTLQTILEKAGAVINWKAPTGAVAEVDSRKQPKGIMGDQLFADNETAKRLLRSRTLDSKIAKLEDQLNSIDYRLDNDAMLQDTNEGLSQSDKINWANNEARRNDLNDKRELIRRKIQDATDEQFSQAKFDANQASKTPSYKDMSDYERGVATVIDALNKLVGVEKLTKPKKYGVYKNIERLGLKPKPLDPKTNKSRVYTSDQQEQLTRQGLNREIVDLALYDFGDITDAMDRVRTRNDLGSLDARDLEQEQGLELGAQEVRATNAMGKMGLENPRFDADERAVMLNEQAQTTEKAGKDDVSSMSIPTDTRSKETLNNDLLIVDRSIRDTKALLPVLQTQSYDSDTNQDLRNAERYLKALEKRKAKILSRLESARYPITQDARAPSIPTEPAGKVKAPIKLSKVEQRNQYIKENSIDERKNAIAAQEYKIEQILLNHIVYKALSTRLDKLRSLLVITKKGTELPKKLPEQSVMRRIARAEKDLKAKRDSIIEKSVDIRNAQSKIVKLKEGIKLAKSKLTISPERVAAKAIKDIKVVNNPAKPINYKMTKAKYTLSKPKPTSSESKLNNGAAIRNKLIINGETVPLAYALNVEGIDKQLAVFKEPGKNLWMVTAIGDPRWITQNHSTRKEAIGVVADKINKAGVAKINKALNDVAKESSSTVKSITPTVPADSKGNASKSEKGFNTSNTLDSAALKKSTQLLADKMLKSTGITARIVDGKEAEQVAERMGMDDYKVGMAYGSLHGFAESKPNKDGSYNVYINPAMQGKLREEILAHELGHITMYGSVMSRDSNAIEAQSVLNAFSTWLTKYGKSDTLYKDLISNKKSPEAALLYLQSGLGDYHMGVLGKETSSYLKEFDEWYADEAGKALLRKINKQAPVGLVQKYFNKLVDYLRKVFGKMSAVEQFLNRLDEQTRTSSVPVYNLSSTATSRDIKLAHTKFKREVDAKYNASISQMAKDLFLDKDWNLRAFKIPALTELADLFHKKRGDETTDNSYWSAKLVHMAKYDEHVTSIMRGASKEQQTKIMAELYNEKLNDNQVTKRAREIRSLFRDLEDYMGTVGIKINSRKNYFPEIADVEYVEKNEFAFKQMMAKYTKEMEGIAKKWNEDVEKRNHYLNQITQPNELMQASDVPQALYDNIVKGEGVYDESAVGQQTPNVRFNNHRIISFLKGRDKFEWETNYLQSSVTDATATYITQVVKRVEYEKRFGVLNKEEKADYVSYRMQSAGRRLLTPDDIANYHKESEHTNKLEWLLRRAQDQGATATQIQKARHYMAAEMGTLGRHTAQWLNDTLGLPMPPAHSPINKKAQALSSGLMSVANVWVLGMSTLTSLADPIGIAVRTGSMSQALSSFKTGLMASISKERSELKVLAEAVGSISDVATKEALAHGYNMAYMTPAVRRMNDWFFRAIGLEQWTQSTRLMAVDAAQGFLKRHDKKPTKHSKRFLRELGIMRGDIKYGRDGKVKVLSYEEYKKASEYDRESDDRLKSAIAEFVDGAILRPNPSQRPAWASDPHYALLFHLKSFMYAFQKTILNPLVHEAKQGNYMPLLMVASYIPVMIAVGMMKDVLKTAGDDDDNFTPTYKEGWDTFDYLWDGAEKGGLFGIMQPILDIQRDRRYGGSGIGAMYSPGLDPDTFDNLPVPFNYSYNNLFSG